MGDSDSGPKICFRGPADNLRPFVALRDCRLDMGEI